MSRVLIDTCAYSAFFRGHAKIQETLQRAEEICLSIVSVGELLAGFALGGKERKNREELHQFLTTPRVSAIGLDEEIAEHYGALYVFLRKAGTPIPTNDLWIAASAARDGLRLVTTDAHFKKVPQILLDLHESD